MNVFEGKDKNTRHYSIFYKNYCSKWIIEDVKVHKIAPFGTRNVKLQFFFSVGMF